MALSLAFDVYGTLIDTHGVVDALIDMIGDDAAAFSQQWREKQLEYSFRRGLMSDYVDFSVCTRQALDYTTTARNQTLSESQKEELMQVYSRLPAFADVAACLQAVQAMGARVFAFSNGSAQAVETLLQNAGIRSYFEGIVSVESVQTFKPNPAVYTHFVEATNSHVEQCWLISSNPFDVLGALHSDWQAVWVQRAEATLFDPWDRPATAVIGSLSGLIDQLSETQ